MATDPPPPTKPRWHRLFTPVDAASLSVFRMLFGAVMLWGVLRFFAYGWIADFYITPKFYFTYTGFEWVRPWPGWGMYLHYGVMGLCALGITLGLFYRLSVVGFFLTFTYAELLDKTNYLNHYYFVSLVSALLLLMPLHRHWSLDAKRRPSLQRETHPHWILWTLRLQLGLVYLFAGIAKLKPDWLWHAQPLKMWLSAHSDFPLIGTLLLQPWVAFLASWLGALFDLTIFFWLLHPTTRKWGYLAVVGFHLFTFKLFYIGLFPWLMIASTLLFFSPSWPRIWRAQPAIPAPATKPYTWRSKLLFSVLIVHFTIQLLLPFRHHLYPGPVSWTEEGFRFSWHVMLIEKTGQVQFRLHDPKSRQRWTVHPRQYLTPLQIKMMSTQPDMILQFAHWLAQRFRAKGYTQIQIYVDAYAALNGRPAQRLIRPDIDLAQQANDWTHKTWILPLRAGSPP